MNLLFLKRRIIRSLRLPSCHSVQSALWILWMMWVFWLIWAFFLKIRLPKSLRTFDGRSNGKLFCWILTSTAKHESRVPAVNETWPKRCDKALFYTDTPMNETYSHAVVFNNMSEGILKLWPKTKAAMQYTHKHYIDKYDWFFKADDDTFVIVENLYRLLSKFDASKPHFLGFRLRPYATDGYNSGGAGYVLSRPALKILVEQLLPNITLCPDGAAEDLQLAICLAHLGIVPGDTRDEFDRNTFFPFRFDEHFLGKMPNGADPSYWYYYPMEKGWKAFSENLVTIHHLSPEEIRFFDLLLYHVKVG